MRKLYYTFLENKTNIKKLTIFLIFVLLFILVEYEFIVTKTQFLAEITSPNYHKFEQQWNIIYSLMGKRALTREEYKILQSWVDYMLSSDILYLLTPQQKFKLNINLIIYNFSY